MDSAHLQKLKDIISNIHELNEGKQSALKKYIMFQNMKVEESTKIIKSYREFISNQKQEEEGKKEEGEKVKQRVEAMKKQVEQLGKQRKQDELKQQGLIKEKEEENMALKNKILEKNNELQRLEAQQRIQISKIREESLQEEDEQAQLNTILREKGTLITELSEKLKEEQKKNLLLEQNQQNMSGQIGGLKQEMGEMEQELRESQQNKQRLESQVMKLTELIQKYSPLMMKGLTTLVGGHRNTMDSLESLAGSALDQLDTLNCALED